MSFPISLVWANPPEGSCPTTIDEAVELYRTLLTGEVVTSYLPYILGSTTPAVEDQDKAWIRLDAAGRPLGTFLFYSGSWRRQYNGKFNEITMFNGNPALFFDATGRGLTTSEWDGWSICNGQNGTPNLTDKFIVAAHMDDSAGQVGYSSVWRTMVSGTIAATGGDAETTLTLAQVPRDARDALIVDRFDAGAARDAAGKVFGIEDGTSTYDYELVAADAGNDDPDTVPTLPPYYALCYCVFTGYTEYMPEPVQLAGYGGITYGVAKPSLARVVDNGVCDTDPRVLERTNEATKLLLDALVPVGGMATYDIVADGTTLLLPPQLENAIEIEVRGDALVNNQSDVRQGWYDLVNNFTYVDPNMQHDYPLQDLFLYPDPIDATILRRKYDFIGLSQGATVRVTGAKRFVPITADTDYLIIQNIRALKTAIMGLERLDVNDPEGGQKYIEAATGMLKAEVTKHLLDPRNSLKRRAKWERDFATYPTNSFGWMRARLALEIPNLLSRGKSEISGLLEMAESRLLSKGLWKGSLETFTASVVNGLIQLPIRVESVLMARIDSYPIDVRSIFFGYQRNGPGYFASLYASCTCMLEDDNEVFDAATGIRRRQYRLTGAQTNSSCLSMVCKLRWMPKEPDEQMVIRNFEALRLMIQGIISEEDEKWQQGMAAQQMAVNEVEKELREFLGGQQSVPHIELMGAPIGGEVL